MRRVAFSFCLVLGLAAGVRPAAAQAAGDSLGAGWGPQQKTARDQVRAGAHVAMAQVIETVRRRTPGKLLDAGIEDGGGRDVYRVRWAAANGRRVDVIVDAATGRVIREEGR